ncbi:DMT family transporter [Sulfitobacter sp. JB4-11]|uniref:DMT family transporter n=1 Tax=Sulfitobacter rhodophyticola TaxID=3238304 RepID=UPI003D8188E5
MTALATSTSRHGIAFMLGGMFFVSLNDMLIKLLAGGYPLHQIIFMRSFVGLVLTFGMLMAEGGVSLLRTGKPMLHTLRCLCIIIANSCMYAAIVAMPLATANAIYFVAPLFVTLLSIPVLGEHVGPRRFAAIGAGFVGVLVMMMPELTAGSAGLGWVVVLPLFAAAGYASMSVLTRKLGATSRASALAIQIQLAFLAISAVMYFIAGDGRYLPDDASTSVRFLLRPWLWPSLWDALVFGGLGAVSAMVGYFMTQAYRLSPAAVVAPFEYVLLLYALFWGWTIFGEWPQPSVFMGVAIVIASGVYVFMREGRRATARRA